MSKPFTTILLGLFILINLVWPLNSHADISFDPNYIISDYELTNYQSMTLEEIQEFLEEVGGTLGQKKFIDIGGQIKPVSKIIYQAAQEYKINPRFLMVLLQREKSLLTNPKPTEDAYNWATGFSCYDYSQPVSRFRGFATQIDRAAWRFRYYLEHPWQFRFEVGQKTKTLVNWKDRTFTPQYSKFVIPTNQTTASLYNYAPHIYDNRLFWKIWHWEIWEKWFGKKDNKFSDGTLVRVKGEAGVWLIQNGKRRPFRSKNVFLLSYNFQNVQDIDKTDLETFEIGRPMTFPNYSLVRASLGQLFMLVDNQKRAISEDIFRAIGFHPDEIIEIEETDLISYENGEPILSPYPTGALLQNSVSLGVYYVKENTKYPIVDITILNVNFPYNHITKVSPKELAKFETGKPIKFRDGTLIKTADGAAVYVIAQGKRLPIFSGETFETIGYQWDAIIVIPKIILDMYPSGEIIRIK